ncbi:MAG: hypothetical protein GDA53_05375 [Rhodobacteraceae bacterium]|nr:hypothetical protein [Paracoccaceae bacterium]
MTGGFKALFDYAQGLSLHVRRNDIKDKIIELTGVDGIAHYRSGLDTSVCRGYWLTPQNSSHHFVQQLGGHIVVTARDNNPCWERFVMVKEMMHLFDTEAQKAGDAEVLNTLLAEFSSSSSLTVPFSPQLESEIESFLQALAVLCPQTFRKRFRDELDQGKTDHYGIALKLRIPEAYVPRLFEDRFDKWLSSRGFI